MNSWLGWISHSIPHPPVSASYTLSSLSHLPTMLYVMSLQSVVLIIYVVVPCAGIALNLYVFRKLINIARRSILRFETTSGLPLCAMTISDSVCLLTQLIQVLFHYVANRLLRHGELGTQMLSLICKLDLYLMHTTSAFSVWCWLMLSVLRYTAVFHPLKYRTIWRQPRNALKMLAACCFSFEIWILFFVVYSSEGQICLEDPAITADQLKFAHLTDIIIFYAIPSLLRLWFDGVVLMRCYSPSMALEHKFYERRCAISVPVVAVNRTMSRADEALDDRAKLALVVSISANHVNSASKKREAIMKRKTRMVMRSIIISVLNLMCNLPSMVLRTFVTLSDGENDFKVAETVSQILYFLQFACNAFYLSTSIFETSDIQRVTGVTASQRTGPSKMISQDEDS